MSIYDVRKLGREYCQTEGSAHYKGGGVEPIDLMISKGIIEDFCIGNIVKYATRFKHTRNLEDLKKVSDYSHILAGVELEKQGREIKTGVCDGCWKEGNCDEPCQKWHIANECVMPNCLKSEVTDEI